ncbi:hypothetical protein DAEQUDRAFT_164097 [Daedalea quercina L-15889]|uniref:Uncharacterized protein n=1 Tax=Daedalea quercina L-15889 TaxID=1314783 RepID=A0A165RH76_9APHY|nr:hypothetical protein DAEQUDRAFT_164097 [Daedalea quercina L-15889]
MKAAGGSTCLSVLAGLATPNLGKVGRRTIWPRQCALPKGSGRPPCLLRMVTGCVSQRPSADWPGSPARFGERRHHMHPPFSHTQKPSAMPPGLPAFACLPAATPHPPRAHGPSRYRCGGRTSLARRRARRKEGLSTAIAPVKIGRCS